MSEEIEKLVLLGATGSIGDHVENHHSRPSENKDECAEKFRERCFL